MAILAFQKPDKVLMLEADSKFGKFEFRPLEPGFGITVGNALRRILLSSLEGFAITTIKIEGVEHELDVYKRQGLYRSLVHNMVVGVSEGYKKELELVGVGYRASNQGNIIELNLGCLLYTSRCV